MKRFALAMLFVGMLASFAIAQTNRSTRPRVAATPTPTPPVLQGENNYPQGTRRPPVLHNDPYGRRDMPVDNEIIEEDDDGVIRVETNLVTMPVSVLDRQGRFISGLRQGDFKIFENGTEQRVEFFQSVEQPFTVVLMIDVSASTKFRIDEIHDAATSFIDKLRPNDRVMVVSFAEQINILTPPTNDRRMLYEAIRSTKFAGGTSLYKAVDHVLNQEFSRISGRKAIVLFTDGVNTTAKNFTYEQTLKDAEETDVLIYPIWYNTERENTYGSGTSGPSIRFPRRRGGGGWGGVIGDILGGSIPNTTGRGRGPTLGTSSEEYRLGREYVETLARNNGGRHFVADNNYNLDAAFTGIAEELRRQYSIGYYPDDPGRIGERKRIMIRVMRPNVVVRAKTSYVVGGGVNSASSNFANNFRN